MGLSPDAFVQMALQLGYYKMHGTSKPTYESAQVRKFAYGRTETCRSVSVESVTWVQAMKDPSLSVSSSVCYRATKAMALLILRACFNRA